MYFNKRLLKYETNQNSPYLDYGEVTQIITDKLINVNMGGSGYILEAVGVSGEYVPKLGDWVTIEYKDGTPIAKGGNGMSSGLTNINDSVLIVSTTDMASGVVDSEHIRANTIEARHITANSIEAQHISANSILSQHISANTIDAHHLKSNIITAEHISANSITANEIQANAIQAQHIQASAINATHISSNAITAIHIQANAVQAEHISANQVQANHISANSVQTNHISSNTIVARHIQSDAITTGHLQADSVTARNISANSVRSEHISANQVQASHISANAVNANHISANQILARHISSNQVTANHILANSIQATHISANQVNASHISANSVQTSHISANTIESKHIKAGQITTSLISANSIISDHLQATIVDGYHIVSYAISANHIGAEVINAQHISANVINAGHIVADAIQTRHISSNTIETRQIKAGAITATLISANSILAQHISANSVQTNHISANSILTRHISANQITAELITANAIRTVHLQANSVTATQISANSIGATHISSDSIQARHLTVDSVLAKNISANQVQTQHISANTIVTSHIQANAITAGLIQAGNITSSHISANSIESGHIKANAIVTDKIQAGSIVSAHISANTVQTNHISSNTIETRHIKANSITASLISANTIQAGHITTDAIESRHIKANQVLANHISANQILTQHISANQITSSHILANQITSAHILANSINASHISANQVKAQHIDVDSVSARNIIADAVQAVHISANSVLAKHISSNQIQATHISANSINATHISANSVQTSHISSNTIESQHIKAGVVNSTHISANAIQTQHISANTIQSNQIKANQILATHISANQVNANHISANSIQTQHISANTITGAMLQANIISGNNIIAESIDTEQLAVGSVRNGLLGQYYTHSGGTNKFLNYKGSQIDPNIDFTWSTNPTLAGQPDNFAVRWQGFMVAPETGNYTFHLIADDGAKVVINNATVINQTVYNNNVEVNSGAVALTKGTWYPILVEYFEGGGGARVNLRWTRPSLLKEIIPSKYFMQGTTVIDGSTILTGSIDALSIKAGSITAQSGVIGSLAIQTANIDNGAITSAKIGNAEVTSIHIASGNIENVHIKNATIEYTKINSVDAKTITVGQLNGSQISANAITSEHISANSIESRHIKANQIDAIHIKAGAITTVELSAGAVTTDKMQAGSITSDIIRAGSIQAEHISTVGLDAQIMQVYNSKTGETLIGGGYLRVDGLDVGVVQSDNLISNGLFLVASSAYGQKRNNPDGIAILGNTSTVVGGHQLWKIDLTTGTKVKAIDIPAKKPMDVAIDEEGLYAYVSVQGDDTVVQIDLATDAITKTLTAGKGPARIKWVGTKMEDHKHFILLNNDPTDVNIPDTLIVIDAPPFSAGGDLYVHHEIPVGNNPYDVVLDDNRMLWVSMGEQGDVVMLDLSDHNSVFWKVKGRIPIAASGTDNYHGGLRGQVGFNQVVGGDASSQYDNFDDQMADMGGAHHHGGYGAPDGSLKKYVPAGLALSEDIDTLYVIDSENNELVIVDKYGHAPYNELTGVDEMSNEEGSPEDAKNGGVKSGGGPRTKYVRYRVPVGDKPDFVEVVNGKLFITLSGSGQIAIIDEQPILNEIEADREFYGYNPYEVMMDPFKPMRKNAGSTISVRTIANVGSKPSHMKVVNNDIYVTLSGQNQIVIIDSLTEQIKGRINTGANPKGLALTPDNRYAYVVNHGGTGDLSFVYPKGAYIGDPFLGLEGGVVYQGAHRWVPDRSSWSYDASGNVIASSSVEFRINEPFLNEGGYAKLTTFGSDYQYAMIEQDITEVTNYSNGDNLLNTIGERLIANSGNTLFYPQNDWLPNTVKNVKIVENISGNKVSKTPTASQYTVYYDSNPRIAFSGGVVGELAWVEADYTCRNDIYFKPHNGSILVAVENGSSPNYNTMFQIDEYVPKFIVVDNQQTENFTPTEDGVDEEYTGLEYSVITNRASGRTPTLSATPVSGNASLVTNGVNTDFVVLPSGNQYVQIDLGDVYMVGKVNVMHEYNTDKKYKGTKTQVSENGTTWYTVYDSAVDGTYPERWWHAEHQMYHQGHDIVFPAKPVRYVRDYVNDTVNRWSEIKVYGDWKLEKGYTYPANSEKAGQQIATNGKGFVSTTVSKAWIALDIAIEFTTWWYMTYIVGPEFGEISIDMPTVMAQNHFLPLESSYNNNVSHRHIMSLPPSVNVQADPNKNIKQGKHRVVVMQESGKVTLDRFRFEDFQYYQRSSILIPSTSSSTVFNRKKIVAEQAKWYQGKGKQATEGAYDAPRRNPDTGLPDKSVPIKYRFRVMSELNADGSQEERGVTYVTSAIFETGKLHTHWRRSEAADLFPASKVESWDSNQPHKTGIQHDHLANGSVRGSKIMPLAIMDHHISNYARISEHKLDLNHPTHRHGRVVHMHDAGPMGTHINMFIDNSEILDSIEDWAGISGNFGTGNTLARGDHMHDDRYLNLSGGTLTGGLILNNNTARIRTKDTSGTLRDTLHRGGDNQVYINSSNFGNVNIDSGARTVFSSTGITFSGNQVWHAGNFNPDSKLSTSGGTMTGDLLFSSGNRIIDLSNSKIRSNTAGALVISSAGSDKSIFLRPNGDTDTNGQVVVNANSFTYSGNTIWTAGNDGANSGLDADLLDGQQGSYYRDWNNLTNKPSTFTPSTHDHADATATADGFMSSGNFVKLQGIEANANNYSHPTGAGNNHLPSGGATGNYIKWNANGVGTWANVSWSDVTSKPSTFTPTAHTHSANQITDLYSNIYTKGEVNTMVANAGDLRGSGNNIFSGQNTFTGAGLGIKIQPSTSLANTTKLIQVNNTGGTELFAVNYSGGVTIKGDLTVEGVQRYSGTTTVEGDYTVNGELIAKGNTTLGDSTTDTTTVNGTLDIKDKLIQRGVLQEVMRYTMFGVGGDFQFQTDTTGTNYEVVCSNYWTFDPNRSALPAVPTGATRKYKLLVNYSTNGGTANLRVVNNGTTTNIFTATLPALSGNLTGMTRTWLSDAFTTTHIDHTDILANVSSGNLVITHIQLIAYDVY